MSDESTEHQRKLPWRKWPGLLEALQALHILPTLEDIESISKSVHDQKSSRPSWNNKKVANTLIVRRSRRTGAAGAVAALPGAFPGIGTVAQIGIMGATFTTETWLILRQLAFLHYEIAAAYGQDLNDEDLLHDLLLAWGLTTGAIIPAREAAKRVGTKVAVSQFRSRVSGRLFMILNRKLGATVLTKFGVKRGGIAVGRLIPMGVGVSINAAVNYYTVKGFGKSSLLIYDELRPRDEDILILGEVNPPDDEGGDSASSIPATEHRN